MKTPALAGIAILAILAGAVAVGPFGPATGAEPPSAKPSTSPKVLYWQHPEFSCRFLACAEEDA